MRIIPSTTLRRPRFTYTLVDVNRDSLVDTNGKTLVFMKDEQNISTQLKRYSRPTSTKLRRPRYTYNLVDTNGNSLVDVNGKMLVFMKDELNITTLLKGLGKRTITYPWGSGFYPWSASFYPWAGLIKNILKRPRFTYTIIDTNGNSLVDINGKTLVFMKDTQNINTLWR